MSVEEQKRREALPRLERRARAVELWASGMAQVDIAELYGVDRATICRDIQEVEKDLRKRGMATLEKKRDREIAEVEAVAQSAWEAYEKSKQPLTKTVRLADASGGQGQGAQVKIQITKEERYGDPRFLEIVLRASERRAKLLGLDAPEKVDMTSAGKPITPAVALTPEQHLAALDAYQHALTDGRRDDPPVH